MYAQIEKPKENKSRAVANTVAQKKNKKNWSSVRNRISHDNINIEKDNGRVSLLQKMCKCSKPNGVKGHEVAVLKKDLYKPQKAEFEDAKSNSKQQHNIIQKVTVSNNCRADAVGNAATLGTFIHGIIENDYLQHGPNPTVNHHRAVEISTSGNAFRADLATVRTATGALVRQGEIKPDNAAGRTAGAQALLDVDGDNAGGAQQLLLNVWKNGFNGRNVPLGFESGLDLELFSFDAPHTGLVTYDCH